MAVFDPKEQRICVRVVYDGAAGAGKTTNLRQLGALFAAQRATEVVSPAELRGRTLYFDWMQIAAGVVCGFPLLCQIISVPGQVAFTERRRHLLASADVIVHVVESSCGGAERAREALRVIEQLDADSAWRTPMVVQANKQDRPGALDGEALLGRLGRTDVPVVEAIAAEGVGVVDTFVSAVRTVARSLQARMESGALRVPVRPAPGMTRLLAQVASAPIDPHGAAELLLEEASASMLFDASPARPASGAHRSTSSPSASPSPALGEHVASPVPTSVASPGARGAPATLFAPLPTAEVPTGFIWPAHTGRAILRRLAGTGALADVVRVDGDEVAHAVDAHVLSTTRTSRFLEPEVARQSLVRAARERTQLGPLLVGDTVLVVQPARDGSCWLWTVMPSLEPIEPWLSGDPARARIELFAAAVAAADAISRRHGTVFAPTLRAFGVQQGRVRYAGPLSTAVGDVPRPAIARAIALELASKGYAAEAFSSAAARELARQLAEEENARGLGSRTRGASLGPEAA